MDILNIVMWCLTGVLVLLAVMVYSAFKDLAAAKKQRLAKEKKAKAQPSFITISNDVLLRGKN